jgi:hypothetical protein
MPAARRARADDRLAASVVLRRPVQQQAEQPDPGLDDQSNLGYCGHVDRAAALIVMRHPVQGAPHGMQRTVTQGESRFLTDARSRAGTNRRPCGSSLPLAAPCQVAREAEPAPR